MAERRQIDEVTHAALRELHENIGEQAARRLLGLSPEAYARALGRLTQQDATIEIIKIRLAEWKGRAA